jgi:hypothetical protein
MRTTSSYSSWFPAIVDFLNWANWTNVRVLANDETLFSTTASALANRMENANLFNPSHKNISCELVLYRAAQFDKDDMKKITQSPTRSRVTIVMGRLNDAVAVAAHAAAEQLLRGWAWLKLDSLDGAVDTTPPIGLGAIDLGRALNGWVYFRTLDAASREFYDRVLLANRANYSKVLNASGLLLERFPSPYAANLYDAMWLFALVKTRNESLSKKALFNSLMTASFQGKTGHVQFDENGDMLLTVVVVNYVLEIEGASKRRGSDQTKMVSKEVMAYNPQTGMFSGSGVQIVWPGGTTEKPVGTSPPKPVIQPFNARFVIIGGVLGSLVVVGGLVLIVRKKHKRLQVRPVSTRGSIWFARFVG